MPIKTDLNVTPFFDDYDIEKQFHRVLFKPSFAVQARELNQLQTILQNQVEQFGGNIFQEGSIIKGCTITQLDKLRYVKVKDQFGFDISQYVGYSDDLVDVRYEIVGSVTGLRGQVVAATRGFETRAPDLNTFYFDYLNTNEVGQIKRFIQGESLSIIRKTFYKSTSEEQPEQLITETLDVTIEIVSTPEFEGQSFGLNISEGIVFQRGHFLFAQEQTIIVSKYNNNPDGVSVGYRVDESIITALQDSSLFDNANGFNNENAPGADRLKLSPILTVLNTVDANEDPTFFALVVYESGNPVLIRNVSQFNSITEELARRTFEESGNYIAKEFNVKISDNSGTISASVGPGIAYVRGYRVENINERFFAIDPVANTATETRNNQAISVNYGRHLAVSSISGKVDIGAYSSRVNLRNAANTVIGSAITKNFYGDKIHLFDIRMTDANTSFSDVARISDTNTVDFGGFVTVAPNFQGTGNPTLIFDSGTPGLKTISDIDVTERAVKTGVVASGTVITISALGTANGEDFSCTNTTNDILVVDSTNTAIPVTSVTTSGDFATLTINLGSAPSGSCAVYYNIRLINLEPFTKNAKTVYVKHAYAAGKTKYSLGLPDVFELLEVKDINGKDITDSFRLVPNQKDNYYDISYMELVPNRPAPAVGLMTIKMNVFERLNTTNKPFFTVNSYNNVSYDRIPKYEASNGAIFNLRNCIDFRPTRTPIATYEVLEANAPTVTNAYDIAPVFPTNSYIIPSEINPIRADVEFFLNRTDVITIDSYGKFAIVKGKEALISRAPKIESDKLVIAEIFVPGSALLSPDQITTNTKKDFTPQIVNKGVKAYTMADIDGISKQVKRLMYYMSLSLLETSTQRLNVLDENGLPRFKNGIIVDPFNDLSIADVQNIEFNASVDFTEKSLSPSLTTIPMNLKFKSGTNIAQYPLGNAPEVATINTNSDQVILIRQDNATTFRSCTSNAYSYVGTGFITPDYDALYDTVTNPVQVDLDLVTPFTQLVDSLQEFVPLTRVSATELISSTTTTTVNTNNGKGGRPTGKGGNTSTTTQTTQVFQDTIRSLQVLEDQRTQNVGDFVTNFEFQPYMRSREVRILMTGLRPNTRHYAFFDQKDVNIHVAPGTNNGNANNPADIAISGKFNDPLISDSNGVVRCIFRIPGATFFVGERDFELMDVDTYTAKSASATSNGFVKYNAYNFSIEKSSLTIATRQAVPTVQETTTLRVVEGRPVTVVQRRNDPIAQTFFIKEGMGRGSDTVFISKVGVFFKRKSLVNGITLEIREVKNGYPAWDVLPFARKHLTPAEVLTSDDSSVETLFEFPVPIRLNTEKEYCFAVKPDADDPEYLIFITKPGAIDLLTGAPINSDWGDGVLFTSTNNRTWTSYQDEDIKFTLYRNDFSDLNGTLKLEIDDPEFLTLNNIVGRFVSGEQVYVEKGASVNITISGTTVSSATNLSTIYSIGDAVKLTTTQGTQLIKVKNIVGANLELEETPIITGSGTAVPVITARIQYHNFRKPSFMYVENSTARTDRRILASDTLVGFDSAATATVASVDNIELSYFQTLITRTNDSVTKTELTGTFTDNTGAVYDRNLDFASYNTFNLRSGVAYSKSNNLIESPEKQFTLTIDLENAENITSSPFIDIGTASLLAYRFNITNSSATTSKYISKAIELVEDFDAEDFRLYVTAYRPPATNIKTFIKFQNKADPTDFKDNEWVELEMVEGNDIYSSTSNLGDSREYVYVIPAANKDINGVATYTNATGTYEGYRKFAVKIELLSENIANVPRIFDYRGIALT